VNVIAKMMISIMLRIECTVLRIEFLVNSFINFELKARKIHEYMDRLLIIYVFNKTIYFFVSLFGTNIGSVKVPMIILFWQLVLA